MMKDYLQRLREKKIYYGIDNETGREKKRESCDVDSGSVVVVVVVLMVVMVVVIF